MEMEFKKDCIICGKPLRYDTKSTKRECAICHKTVLSNAVCSSGHFVCDECHNSNTGELIAVLTGSHLKNPYQLFEEVVNRSWVHLHGPEHHSIVAGVLLTAFYNNGGEISLSEALLEATRRGEKVPGGICGYWGTCGAAVGAGIFASILLHSAPLNKEVWHLPQLLTAQCLMKNAQSGGPRCCKRTSRTAIEEGIRFSKEQFGISMPTQVAKCTFSGQNRECIKESCKYYDLEEKDI